MSVPPESTEYRAPGRREQNKADKLGRIRRAASRLFSEQGFDDTTIADVAREAGVAKGTVFLYAPTKKDLLSAVFIDVAGSAWVEAFRAVDSTASVLDQVLGAFDHVTAEHERNPLLSSAIFRELPFVDDALAGEIGDFLSDWFDQLDALLVAAVERGELQKETPCRDVAFGLYAAWLVALQRRYAGVGQVDRAQARYHRSFTVQLAGWMVQRPELPD